MLDMATKRDRGSIALKGHTHYRHDSMWSDGTTVWRATGDPRVIAYSLRTGARVPGLDFSTGGNPEALWSDGETFWVLEIGSRDSYTEFAHTARPPGCRRTRGSSS